MINVKQETTSASKEAEEIENVLQQGKTTIQEWQSRHTIGERRKRDIIDIIATGNIQRISLCPRYSSKQIRTIPKVVTIKIHKNNLEPSV
jgi:ribosome maturation protein Sdo1